VPNEIFEQLRQKTFSARVSFTPTQRSVAVSCKYHTSKPSSSPHTTLQTISNNLQEKAS